VLDLVFVTKGEEGAVAGLALADIDADGDLDLKQLGELKTAGVLTDAEF
jgi:hypothetical protein